MEQSGKARESKSEEKPKQPKKVALRLAPNAHVDVMHTQGVCLSKTASTMVDAAIARLILADPNVVEG